VPVVAPGTWEWTAVRAAVREEIRMLDKPEDDEAGPLSHDLPCVRCGHAAHPYLVCGNGCECQPTRMPGQGLLTPH